MPGADLAAAKPVIVIGGPTAGGKSSLALAIARAFAGTVINADSMQVYRDLPILTAQPDAADQAAVPHRLYGLLPLDDICSAARWSDLALAEIAAAHAGGRLPILVGGTGLYLRSLMQGLSPIPSVSPEHRQAAQRLFSEIGVTGLHTRLAAEDPEMARRLHPHDSQRVMRAWEVLQATGTSLASWQAVPAVPPTDLRFQSWVVLPPRERLYAACDRRFQTMIEHGALDEVEATLARYGRAILEEPSGKALGFRDLADVLAGRQALERAIAAAQQATRNYAKRQTTWFRHQMAFANFISEIGTKENFSESSYQKIFQNIRDFVLTPN
ncbi:MAG: tRNA (adenosine(37)-N6)-dimethylallyltransferase MiaA [Dongiaceae bacterium]